MTTGNWSTGSVTTHVGNLVGWASITSISGTTLTNIAEQNINYVEQYTTDTINSDAISEKYQPVIIKLTHADVLIAMESQQAGIDTVSLGDLSVSQGAGGGAELAQQLKDEAMLRLKELQRKVRFNRVIGV
jgi:hypothetical protein